ncbi:MAG: signal peptidase I [Clostridia bacterium]|nr:signal peptidase I [Clostridia bacterium]
MKVLKKVGSILVDVLIVLVMLIALLVIVSSISARSNDGVGNVFGVTIFSVQSDSMSGTFEEGDVILGKVYNRRDVTLEEGDVITFWYYTSEGRIINTHRIVDVISDGVYQTQGDAESQPDEKTIATAQIIAYYDYDPETQKDDITVLPGLGKVIDFLKEPAGFLIFIILPLLALTAYEVYNFVQNLKAYRQEKKEILAQEQAKDKFDSLTEEQKQELFKKYMEEQQKQQQGNDQQ